MRIYETEKIVPDRMYAVVDIERTANIPPRTIYAWISQGRLIPCVHNRKRIPGRNLIAAIDRRPMPR